MAQRLLCSEDVSERVRQIDKIEKKRVELIRTRLCVKESSGIQEGYEWDEKHCFLLIVGMERVNEYPMWC